MPSTATMIPGDPSLISICAPMNFIGSEVCVEEMLLRTDVMLSTKVLC